MESNRSDAIRDIYNQYKKDLKNPIDIKEVFSR